MDAADVHRRRAGLGELPVIVVGRLEDGDGSVLGRVGNQRDQRLPLLVLVDFNHRGQAADTGLFLGGVDVHAQQVRSGLERLVGDDRPLAPPIGGSGPDHAFPVLERDRAARRGEAGHHGRAVGPDPDLVDALLHRLVGYGPELGLSPIIQVVGRRPVILFLVPVTGAGGLVLILDWNRLVRLPPASA